MGSEMCIRDSSEAPELPFEVINEQVRPHDVRRALRLDHGDGPLPVSYTHLTLPTIYSV